MISGSADVQTSADVFNTGQFQLPDPAGKAGGACTSALLKVLYNQKQTNNNDNGNNNNSNLSWVECLRRMRTVLGQMGYDQVPQLTSSRMIDVQVCHRIRTCTCVGGGELEMDGEGGLGSEGTCVCVYI